MLVELTPISRLSEDQKQRLAASRHQLLMTNESMTGYVLFEGHKISTIELQAFAGPAGPRQFLTE